MNTRIRLSRSLLGEEELESVRTVLDSGYLTMGPRVTAFEAVIAQRVGTRYAVATSSATTALHLAMVALDIGPGDEVILPSFTFPATGHVVIQQGAVPVLADIDPCTLNLDAADLARKFTQRTRAVIAVHLFGNPADMEPILALTRPRGIPVVEDAACALGAHYQGVPCGSLGVLGCFSFHPRKIITTGEGGMITTNDPLLAERIQRLRQHGGDRVDGRFQFVEPGFNYRLSDIHAAIGIAQMQRLDAILEARTRFARSLSEGLSAVPGVQLPVVTPHGFHTFQTYCVILDAGISRDQVISAMNHANIETTIGTYALHGLGYMQARYGYQETDLPVSAMAGRQGLSLPIYPGLDEHDAARIVAALAEAVRGTT